MTYSEMRRMQIESEVQERKELLDKCEVASRKIDEGNPEGREELFKHFSSLMIYVMSKKKERDDK